MSVQVYMSIQDILYIQYHLSCIYMSIQDILYIQYHLSCVQVYMSIQVYI